MVLVDRKHHSSIRMAWIEDRIGIAASYFAPALCVYFTYVTSLRHNNTLVCPHFTDENLGSERLSGPKLSTTNK